MRASPVAGVYDETVDRESASEILQKRTAEQSDAAAEQKDAKKTGGGGARSDSFGETVVKQVVKSGVPMLTRVLESFLKGKK